MSQLGPASTASALLLAALICASLNSSAAAAEAKPHQAAGHKNDDSTRSADAAHKSGSIVTTDTQHAPVASHGSAPAASADPSHMTEDRKLGDSGGLGIIKDAALGLHKISRENPEAVSALRNVLGTARQKLKEQKANSPLDQLLSSGTPLAGGLGSAPGANHGAGGGSHAYHNSNDLYGQQHSNFNTAGYPSQAHTHGHSQYPQHQQQQHGHNEHHSHHNNYNENYNRNPYKQHGY